MNNAIKNINIINGELSKKINFFFFKIVANWNEHIKMKVKNIKLGNKFNKKLF